VVSRAADRKRPASGVQINGPSRSGTGMLVKPEYGWGLRCGVSFWRARAARLGIP